MELIGNEIEKDAKRPHIVDIMPNLRFLLRCEKYIQEPEYDMKNFEKRVRSWGFSPKNVFLYFF